MSWGTGDFCGGLASRYSSVLTAMLASQVVGFAATALILSLSGEAAPPRDAVASAALAGLSGIVGLGAFYRALARGTMGLIAPLAALIGAGVPALLDLYGGQPLGPLRLAGMLVALGAIVLISLPTGSLAPAEQRAVRIDLADVPLVVISGLGFAGFFLFLDGAASAGGGIWWSLGVVRLVGLAAVGLAIGWSIGRAGRDSLNRRAAGVFGVATLRAASISALLMVPLFALTGVGDLGGNIFFVLANEHDSLAVAVVLSSLYPVITTVLAAVVLRERLRPLQLLGIALAVTGVALISGGDALQGV